jgi:hypothetical protein
MPIDRAARAIAPRGGDAHVRCDGRYGATGVWLTTTAAVVGIVVGNVLVLLYVLYARR